MSIITIDCGASFIKGAIFEDSVIIKQIQEHSPVVHGDMEITKAVQIETLISLVHDMILELAEGRDEVVLCISNEMHGFLLAYENGRPYTDYISWQKEYGMLGEAEKKPLTILKAPNLADEILYTGMPLRAGLPSCNLLYLSQNGYLAKPKLFFYTLGDYILKNLSGQEPICHPTNAAATGLYDLRSGKWNSKLLQAVGAQDIIFPMIGNEAISFEIANIRVTAYPALGDQQAALFGAGLIGDKTISFNLGTGAQVSRIVYKPEYSGNYQIRPYFNGMYLQTIPHLPSGRALNVYIRFIRGILEDFDRQISEDDIWEVLLRKEKNVTYSPLECDMSFFENPITNYTVGKISNIGEHSLKIEELMYSVFRQMGSNFIWAADQIEPDRLSVEEIVFSGGIARKIERIREYILKHYKKDVKVRVALNETLTGLYKYGMRGS